MGPVKAANLLECGSQVDHLLLIGIDLKRSPEGITGFGRGDLVGPLAEQPLVQGIDADAVEAWPVS